MISNRLSILPLIMSIAMISVGPAFAAESTSSMTVEATCGITLGDPLDFGSVIPGAVSEEATLEITGTGSTGSTLATYASHWLHDATHIIVDGEFTKFGLVTGDYASKTALNVTNTSIPMGGNVTNQVTNTTYWQVALVLNDATFEGAVQQVLTIEVTGCV